MNRFTQASSFAGYALILEGLSKLFASKFSDITAYGLIVGGVAAVIKNEGT
jgi:hypothetical protein